MSATTSSRSAIEDVNPSEFNCPLCLNWRWVLVDANARVGDEQFGKMAPCECQRTVWNTSPERALLAYSLISPRESLITFRDTLPEGRSELADSYSFRTAFDAAREFTRNPDASWLLIQGAPGVGKTHLAIAIVRELIQNNTPVRYERFPMLLEYLKEHIKQDDSHERLEQAIKAPILVLDGISCKTEWDESRLEYIIEERLRNSQKPLPTVLTADINPEFNNPRIMNRLSDENIVKKIVIKASNKARGISGLTQQQVAGMSFDNFTYNNLRGLSAVQKGSLIEGKKATEDFARYPEGLLYIGGPTGVGKTHLSVAIVSERLRIGDDALFHSVPTMMDELRKTYSREGKSGDGFYTLFNRLKDADLLVLDDLGSGSITEWSEEKLYQLITHRYDNRLPTVINSRGSLGPVAPEDDREFVTLRSLLNSDTPRSRQHLEGIMSRFSDARFVTELFIDAPDYRSNYPRR